MCSSAWPRCHGVDEVCHPWWPVVTAHLSYGRAQVAAPPPSLSGTCGTLPAHRWEESGWIVVPQNMLPEETHGINKIRHIHSKVNSCLFVFFNYPIRRFTESHHYLHRAPAGCSPVHGHALVYHMGHCSNRFCTKKANTKMLKTLSMLESQSRVYSMVFSLLSLILYFTPLSRQCPLYMWVSCSSLQ